MENSNLWKEINQQEEIPDEIWAEAEKICPVDEERLPGDLDYHDMMKHYNVGPNQADDKMRKLVDSGKFRFVTVFQKGHHIRVIRKV